MTILTSIHGRKAGLDALGNFEVNLTDGGSRGVHLTTTITSAQLLALFTTPIAIVPAPGVGFANVVNRITIHKPAGTAYAGVALGEDLVAKYTGAAGAQISGVIETTGFLDSAGVQTRVVGGLGSTGATASDIALVDNAAVVLHLLAGDVITGTAPLYVRVSYDVVAMAFTM